MNLEREFALEATKSVAIGTPEYREMIENFRDNLIDNPDDIEPGDFTWEFRHEFIEELLQTINE
ncbi:hypothetical protein BH11CYA1_BH11CYA1_49000 [soil metagenome]